MTVKEFNELVWNYGASGSKVLEGLTAKEKEAVVNTWNDVEFELNNDTEEEKIDSMINSYYKDTKYRISFSYYNLNGEIVNGDGNFRAEINVKAGEIYKIKGGSFWQMPLYVILIHS